MYHIASRHPCHRATCTFLLLRGPLLDLDLLQVCPLILAVVALAEQQAVTAARMTCCRPTACWPLPGQVLT